MKRALGSDELIPKELVAKAIRYSVQANKAAERVTEIGINEKLIVQQQSYAKGYEDALLLLGILGKGNS